MARSWYLFSVNGLALTCPLTPERAAALQVAGHDLRPATRPADAGQRVASVAVGLLQPIRPLGKG